MARPLLQVSVLHVTVEPRGIRLNIEPRNPGPLANERQRHGAKGSRESALETLDRIIAHPAFDGLRVPPDSLDGVALRVIPGEAKFTEGVQRFLDTSQLQSCATSEKTS